MRLILSGFVQDAAMAAGLSCHDFHTVKISLLFQGRFNEETVET